MVLTLFTLLCNRISEDEKSSCKTKTLYSLNSSPFALPSTLKSHHSFSFMSLWILPPSFQFLPGESQGRGAWWASVYGVAQSWTWLTRLSSSSSSHHPGGRKNLGLGQNKIVCANASRVLIHAFIEHWLLKAELQMLLGFWPIFSRPLKMKLVEVKPRASGHCLYYLWSF